MKEIRHIQKSFKSSRKTRSPEDVARSFSKLVMEGKVSAALKLLDRESTTGVLNLSKEVLDDLKKKHPPPEPVKENSLLEGPVEQTLAWHFDAIDEQTILKAALNTKGSAGPSGMDAELYRRILCSKNFQTTGKALREQIALLAKNLATKIYNPCLISAYINSRLIALDKSPGVRPIGIGEVLRRIVGKTISQHCSNEIKEAAGPLQTCAGHGAGAEAAIHAMRKIFESEGTDAVLLIDASNAFNRLNRAVALHNIRIICPEISNYIINTYRQPSRLFIAGGQEILSQEGTTQGDPLAMPWYSLSTTTMISHLQVNQKTVNQVWLADDASAAGSIEDLHRWYCSLDNAGKQHGYFVNGSKSWLIVKTQEMAEKAKGIFGETVNITTEGKRHLGAVIGSANFKREYCESKVNTWIKELTTLCEFAETQPQAAYAAYTKGYKSKFTFFLRTIENFDEYLSPIDSLLDNTLIPKLFGAETLEVPRELLALNPNDGGIGVTMLSQVSSNHFKASTRITQPHVESIINQDSIMRTTDADGKCTEDLIQENKTKKQQQRREQIENIDISLPEHLKTFVEQTRDKGASSWLNALPIKEQHLTLNKEEFRDSLRLRYNLPLSGLPTNCPCGERFDVTHALSCKKGGFVSQRHDNTRDLLTLLLDKVCTDVEAEPHLIPVTGEQMTLKSANTKDESRLDIKAKGFWQRGQTAFFDIRITHVNSTSQKNKATSVIFRSHEEAKKREYLQRVLDIEQGAFTPLVFGTNGGMGEECRKFISHLSNKLAEKTNDSYASVCTWIRTRLSMEIMRSAILCVRGSRVPFRKRIDNLDDFTLMNVECSNLTNKE